MRWTGLLFWVMICVWCAAHAHAQQAGTLDYDSAVGNFKFFDGTSWFYFDTRQILLSSCNTPGSLEYDNILLAYKLCDGMRYKRIAGAVTLKVCLKQQTLDFIDNTYMICRAGMWVNIKGSQV